MKIDLTCPVELWQFTMPSEGHPECGFVLNNLSDKVVVSVQVTLIGYGQGETLLFRQVERAQGLSAGAGERFSLSLLPAHKGQVQRRLPGDAVRADDGGRVAQGRVRTGALQRAKRRGLSVAVQQRG